MLNENNSNMDSVIILDNHGVIFVNHEKKILAEEVIKHFRPRWQKEAMDEMGKGKAPNVTNMVSVMFKKMSLDHFVEENPLFMDVLNGLDVPAMTDPGMIPEIIPEPAEEIV